MSFEEIPVNLDLPPIERWSFLKAHTSETDVLIGYYLNDLGDVSFFADVIDYYKATFVKKEYLEEIRCIAAFSKYSENDILITNLHYDALKFVFGCTAFSGQRTMHRKNTPRFFISSKTVNCFIRLSVGLDLLEYYRV
jgi:acid ceramidase